MKLIFLDFDGVLNSNAWLWRRPEPPRGGTRLRCKHDAEENLDPGAVAQVQRIIDETGARIVVSSSWRKQYSLPQLCWMLRLRGLRDRYVIGATPDYSHAIDHVERGYEIRGWLEMLGPRHQPDGFVVLDDDSDMTAVADHFVRCDWLSGLTFERADDAIKVLRRPALRSSADSA